MSLFLSLCSGRTALLMGIDNENLEMIELLLEFKVKKILLDGQQFNIANTILIFIKIIIIIRLV